MRLAMLNNHFTLKDLRIPTKLQINVRDNGVQVAIFYLVEFMQCICPGALVFNLIADGVKRK